MNKGLPLEVLGSLAPLLCWVEGEERARLPEAWETVTRTGKNRATAWLRRELPTYSHDNVDEILKATLDKRRRSEDLEIPHLFPGPGLLGERELSPLERADLAYGWPIAKALGALDIGQTLVVEDSAILAVEAIEGTDAAILRGGRLGRGRACVIKVLKSMQDRRFDLPAVGPGTLDAMVEAKATVLAFEAPWTIILDREPLLARANAQGIAIIAWAGDVFRAEDEGYG